MDAVRWCHWTVACLIAILPLNGPAAVTKPLNPDQSQGIFYRYPLITAPLLKAAPEIDGTIHEDEWLGAAHFFPLGQVQSGEPLPPSGVFRVGYTKDAICIAFRVHRRPEAASAYRTPRQSDHVEILIRDLFGLDFEYSFAMDFAGRRVDGERREGFQDTNRVRQWQGKGRRLPDGYEGEFAIPFGFFKRQTPKPGDMWEIQVLHHRMQPYPATLSCAVQGMRRTSRDMAYLRFGDATTPGISWALDNARRQVIIDATGGVDRELKIEARLLAANGSPFGYYEALSTRLATAGDVLPTWESVDVGRAAEKVLTSWKQEKTWSQSLSYKVGGGASLALAIPDEPGSHLLHCRVLDAASGSVLAAGTWPLQSRKPLMAKVIPATLQMKSLEVVADYVLLESVPEKSSVVARLRQPGRDRVLVEQRAPASDLLRQTILNLPVDQRVTGKFEVEVAVESGTGHRLASTVCPVELPETPVWWDKQLGLSSRSASLPPPWTPPRFDDRRAEVWGRVIDFKGRMLPAQITHQAAGPEPVDMLTGDIRLVVNGSQQVTIGQARVLDRTDWRLTRSADLHSLNGGLRGSLTMELEADGFIHYLLVLSPVGTRPVTIDQLSLQIPLRREIAQYYQLGPGDTRADAYHASWKAGTVGQIGFEAPFACNLWLGNRDLGLDLTFESDQNWSPIDRPDAISVRVAGQTVMARIDMMARGASALRGEVRFEWGMLPTPARPRQRGALQRMAAVGAAPEVNQLTQRIDGAQTGTTMRRYAAAGVNACLVAGFAGEPGAARTVPVWSRAYALPGLEPFGNSLSWRQRAAREFAEVSRASGMQWVPIEMLRNTPAGWGDLQPWWAETINVPTFGDDGVARYNPTPVFQDWFLYHLQQAVRNMGTRSLYTDSSPLPRFTANLATGDGWFDEAGRLRGKYPIFANRVFHRRIWRMLHSESTSSGLVIAGGMPCMMPAVESFVDLHVASPYADWSALMRDREGEGFVRFYGESRGIPVLVARGSDYMEPSSHIEAWAALAQFDAGLIALPSQLGNAAELRQGAYASQNAVIIQDVWRAWGKFPWNESKWVPFWQSAAYVSCDAKDVRCALHVAPGKMALLAVSNYQDRLVKANLQLHADQLGLAPGSYQVIDAVLGESLAIADDGSVELEVPSARLRYLVVSPR